MTTGLKVIEMRRALSEGILRDDSYAELLPMNLSATLQLRKEAVYNRILKDYMQYHWKAVSLLPIAGSDLELLSMLTDTNRIVAFCSIDAGHGILKADIKRATTLINSMIDEALETRRQALQNQEMASVDTKIEQAAICSLRSDLLPYAISAFDTLSQHLRIITSWYLVIQYLSLVITVAAYSLLTICLVCYIARHIRQANDFISNAFSLKVKRW